MYQKSVFDGAYWAEGTQHGDADDDDLLNAKEE